MMFLTSEKTDLIDLTLAKVQSELEPAIRDKKNPHFNSTYSDLKAIWDVARPLLSKYEVSITQWPIHSDDEYLHLITRVAYQGQWIMAEMSLPVQKKSAHGYGSAITYAKRYALAAMLGIIDQEDDDGNMASKPQQQIKPPQKSQEYVVRGPSEDQIKRLYTIATNHKYEHELVKRLVSFLYKKDSTTKLTQAEYEQFTDFLSSKPVEQVKAKLEAQDV